VAIQHDGPPELFNLDDDLAERRNLASQQPERLQELLNAFDTWQAQFKP
jgi:hypothetical protein